ncbi:MAG: putative cobaltochelatase [Thermodesulfobacteriota bacterium]|nr:putative cobaltochelatase [Thermodesulfobacteriota bacterium]
MDWTTKHIYPFSAIVGQKDLKMALLLNAVLPSIGGVLIRGEKGTAKSTAVRALAALLPEIEVVTGCPFNCDPHHYQGLCADCRARVKQGDTLPVINRKIRVIDLPLGCTEDRVVGMIDLEYAIKEGKKRFEPGLLAGAHRGILYIDEVNLLHDHIVDIILDAAAMGVNIVEREGIAYTHPAEFILIGTMNPEEGELRPQLLDRFGLCVQVEGIESPGERVEVIKRREDFEKDPAEFVKCYQNAQHALAQRIIGARKLIPSVRIPEEMLRLCSTLALEAHVAGQRADIIMRKTAIAIASLDGRKEVTEDDIKKAAGFVLLHRMRMPPQPRHEEKEREEPDESSADEDQARAESRDNKSESQKEGRRDKEQEGRTSRGQGEGEQEDQGSGRSSLETIFPTGTPFRVKPIQAKKDRVVRKGSGRRSRTETSTKAGRYVRSTLSHKDADFALDATIRAAAPYQRERKREDIAIAIEESDIRGRRREKRIGNFIVFVVDASGSMGAGKRMIATKGAILSLLIDAYQKRDRVAMVAFKGDRAEVLLPPTNSIELTYKLLEELPTGGKTPLSHGITLGYEVIDNFFHKDSNIYPLFILISDGKANVSLYGGKPVVESMEIANVIRDDSRIRSVVIDVEKAGMISFGLARQLSIQMGARYFKIEDLKANDLLEAIRDDLFQ